jgi:hypothetical protein
MCQSLPYFVWSGVSYTLTTDSEDPAHIDVLMHRRRKASATIATARTVCENSSVDFNNNFSSLLGRSHLHYLRPRRALEWSLPFRDLILPRGSLHRSLRHKQGPSRIQFHVLQYITDAYDYLISRMIM